MQPIQFFAARAEDGALVPGATVDVFVSGTQTRAALFLDSLGNTPLGNPFLADKNARVFFYTSTNRIDVHIHRGGYSAPLLRDIVVTDPDDVLALTNGVYRTVAQGLAATVSGKIFQVLAPEAEAAYAIYENVGGVAVDTGKRIPTRYLLDRVENSAKQYADAAEAFSEVSRLFAEAAAAYAGRNFGPLSADPITNPLGEPLVAGDRYFNTSMGIERVYNGNAWLTPNADGQQIQQYLSDTTDPGKGAGMLGRGVIAVDSILSLQLQLRSTDRRYELRSYHSGRLEGGGAFLWVPSLARTLHNGGTVISPTVLWDGTLAAHASFLLGVGETQPAATGCFVRVNQYRWPIQMFGAVADWNGATGFDNRYAIEACIKAVDSIHIPRGDYGVAAAGSIFIQGYDDKLISGAGTLHKMGSKGIFSFNTCNNIRIRDIVMDGQIVADEAANGSIWGNGRTAANYAFAVSFASCHRSSVMNSRIYDFAWDGLVAQGAVAVGGESAVLSTEIKFMHNNIRSVRGTQIWIKAIYGGEITSNKLWNPTAFAQKANGIFVVEWNSEIIVAHNRMSWIGDNAIGLGQMQNRVPVARNRQINVHDNLIKTTRYHAVLIAPGEDVNVHHNTIFEAGAKSLMPGETSAVLTAAITVLGGEIDPINARIRVADNIIRYPYEYGIYAYDRVGTPTGSGSSSIVIEGNLIFGAGRADFAERIDSGGIRTQLVVAPRISANDIDWIVGDGIRVFGDAKVDGNQVTRVVGIGINVPADTIWGNLSLTSAIVNNTVVDCTRSGIIVAGRKQASLVGNTCERCGMDVAPAVQNITTAGSYAGIMTFNVERVSMSGNILRNNGGPGFVGRTCLYIKDQGSVFSGNAKVLRDTQNLQSGAYIEGASGSLTKVTFITSGGDGGTTQYYPIRVLFGNANSVTLDGDFINHTSVPIGITPKSLINIAA